MTKILRGLGVDADVGWIFIARLANMVAGVVVLFPITYYLTPVEQGYYYTFASIIALQALFDLGLVQVLVQVTSHEFPFLPATNDEWRSNRHVRRLCYFAGFANRWYLGVCSGFVVVVTGTGLFYFDRFGGLDPLRWAPPWVALVFLTSVNLFLSPRLAFVEGAGQPGRVAMLRLCQTLVGYALLIAALVGRLGLWALVAIPATQALMTATWLAVGTGVPDFFRSGMRSREVQPEWRREVLGLQWRVALSWVGGYLATLVFTPLLFAYQGAAAAGRWGLSFALFSQLGALGTSWISAKVPRLGALIARGDRATLDREFASTSAKSVGFVALGGVGLIMCVAIAHWLELRIVSRILGMADLGLLAAATIASAAIVCLAAYIRAHKEEPLATSSLVIGCATAVSAALAAQWGETYVALAYAGVTVVVNFPWRYVIYRSYRARSGIGRD